MNISKKHLFLLFFCIFLLFPFSIFGQTSADSYEKLWKIIQSDTITKKDKSHYLDIYIQKARDEKNEIEEYRALEKKAFQLPDTEALLLTDRLLAIGKKIENDSLVELGLLTKASFHYADRNFKEALRYAIQAETYNVKTKNNYQLNGIRINIGNIYYHTRHYQKAAEYFNQAKEYYKTSKKYNHIQGYVSSLYSLGRTYWQLNQPQKLQKTIVEAEKIMSFLRYNDRRIETAYIDYVKGGQAFLRKNYSDAQKYLEKALPVIQQNEDFTNEHVIYLYMGKIAWEQNREKEALAYFTKIDGLFREKKFLNYELRETYKYLIAYYRETQQLPQQLEVTESLIALNQQFEKEQQTITNTLYYDLETKKLQASKEALQKKLKSSKTTYVYMAVIGSLFFLAAVVYGIRQKRQKEVWYLNYKRLMDEMPQRETTLNTVKKSEEHTENKPEKQVSLTITEIRLLKALQVFEKEKQFLTPLKLEDLAEQFGVGRTVLSNFFNSYKGNFNQYINNLRIQTAVDDLKKDNGLRKCSIQHLAEFYGFNNAKTFSNQFKNETGITPAYFIKQLELDNFGEPTAGTAK